jgi:hypothetical protein
MRQIATEVTNRDRGDKEITMTERDKGDIKRQKREETERRKETEETEKRIKQLILQNVAAVWKG